MKEHETVYQKYLSNLMESFRILENESNINFNFNKSLEDIANKHYLNGEQLIREGSLNLSN